MIKVISLTGGAWNTVSSKDSSVYECSYLDKLLDEGWKIKDWKLAMGSSSYRSWTFILEKDSNQNSNLHINRISDTCLQLYHWQFIVDITDEHTIINVYETRSNDIIGILTKNITLTEIEKTLSNFSEDEVYNWIGNNIEYV